MGTMEEERQRLAEATAALSSGNNLMAQNSADTYPLGQGPDTDDLNLSPPLSGGTGPSEAAPAMDGTNESRSGGGNLVQDRGKPIDYMNGVDEEIKLNIAEGAMESSGTVKGKKQKKEMQEVMASQGMDPSKAIDQMQQEILKGLRAARSAGKITPKGHKRLRDRWKNIFNVIPKEDMGLFLMDFGLRMMAAGETMGNLAAVGTAGMGALQGVQARGEAATEQNISDIATSHEMAMDRFGALKGGSVESTRGGLMQQGPDGTWDYIEDPATGKPAQREYATNRPYQGRDAFISDMAKRAGYEETEILPMLLGASPPEERRQKFRELVLKMKGDATFTEVDPIIGKKYRDFNREDINSWVEAMMEDESQASALQRAHRKYGDNP